MSGLRININWIEKYVYGPFLLGFLQWCHDQDGNNISGLSCYLRD